MPAVNLLPNRYADLRRQRGRTRAWAGVGLLVLGVAVLMGSHLLFARHEVEQLAGELERIQAQHLERSAALARAEREQHEQLAAANVMVKLRPAHQVPRQLQRFFARVPAGVVFEEITAWTPGNEASRSPTRALAAPTESSLAALVREGLTLKISGYALGHDDLNTLARVLREQTIWTDVSPIRGEWGPYRQGEAVAFELVCRTEETP
jgi:Tfp pilus assembly protein PilN